jgi:hypothetical protein
MDRTLRENNWVVVSGDKRLETVPENRQAIIEARVKVFLLTDSNSFPKVWAAAIIGRYRMQEIIDANSGPFFVNITKRSDKHLDRLRLPYGFSRPDNPQHAEEKPGSTAEDSVIPFLYKLHDCRQRDPKSAGIRFIFSLVLRRKLPH